MFIFYVYVNKITEKLMKMSKIFGIEDVLYKGAVRVRFKNVIVADVGNLEPLEENKIA